MRSLIMMVPIGLVACAPAGGSSSGAPPESGPPAQVRPREPAGSCNADAVQDLRGKHLNDQLVAIARQRSGARDVRVIQPGQAVTMDFSPDRLNIEVMEDSRILALRCG